MNCQLPTFNQCCCTCKYRLTDYHHCWTSPELRTEKGTCVCSTVKGYICALPDLGGAHSNWPEHSLCELHTPKDEK